MSVHHCWHAALFLISTSLFLLTSSQQLFCANFVQNFTSAAIGSGTVCPAECTSHQVKHHVRRVRVWNPLCDGYLASNRSLYPLRYADGRGSSAQQIVFCGDRDSDSIWELVAGIGNAREDSSFWLIHERTRRLLNTHAVAHETSPCMLEVSGFIDYTRYAKHPQLLPKSHFAWKIQSAGLPTTGVVWWTTLTASVAGRHVCLTAAADSAQVFGEPAIACQTRWRLETVANSGRAENRATEKEREIVDGNLTGNDATRNEAENGTENVDENATRDFATRNDAENENENATESVTEADSLRHVRSSLEEADSQKIGRSQLVQLVPGITDGETGPEPEYQNSTEAEEDSSDVNLIEAEQPEPEHEFQKLSDDKSDSQSLVESEPETDHQNETEADVQNLIDAEQKPENLNRVESESLNVDEAERQAQPNAFEVDLANLQPVDAEEQPLRETLAESVEAADQMETLIVKDEPMSNEDPAIVEEPHETSAAAESDEDAYIPEHVASDVQDPSQDEPRDRGSWFTELLWSCFPSSMETCSQSEFFDSDSHTPNNPTAPESETDSRSLSEPADDIVEPEETSATKKPPMPVLLASLNEPNTAFVLTVKTANPTGSCPVDSSHSSSWNVEKMKHHVVKFDEGLEVVLPTETSRAAAWMESQTIRRTGHAMATTATGNAHLPRHRRRLRRCDCEPTDNLNPVGESSYLPELLILGLTAFYSLAVHSEKLTPNKGIVVVVTLLARSVLQRLLLWWSSYPDVSPMTPDYDSFTFINFTA